MYRGSKAESRRFYLDADAKTRVRAVGAEWGNTIRIVRFVPCGMLTSLDYIESYNRILVGVYHCLPANYALLSTIFLQYERTLGKRVIAVLSPSTSAAAGIYDTVRDLVRRLLIA